MMSQCKSMVNVQYGRLFFLLTCEIRLHLINFFFYSEHENLLTVKQRYKIRPRAQFHRAAKHTHFLSMKFLSWLKRDFQPSFPLLHNCLLLVFSCCCLLNLKITWNLVGILFLSRNNFHDKQTFCARQLYEFGPRWRADYFFALNGLFRAR